MATHRESVGDGQTRGWAATRCRRGIAKNGLRNGRATFGHRATSQRGPRAASSQGAIPKRDERETRDVEWRAVTSQAARLGAASHTATPSDAVGDGRAQGWPTMDGRAAKRSARTRKRFATWACNVKTFRHRGATQQRGPRAATSQDRSERSAKRATWHGARRHRKRDAPHETAGDGRERGWATTVVRAVKRCRIAKTVCEAAAQPSDVAVTM